MTRRTLTLEDLRIEPDELHNFADQISNLPPSAPSGWEVPTLNLSDNVSLHAEWNDGPTFVLRISFD